MLLCLLDESYSPYITIIVWLLWMLGEVYNTRVTETQYWSIHLYDCELNVITYKWLYSSKYFLPAKTILKSSNHQQWWHTRSPKIMSRTECLLCLSNWNYLEGSEIYEYFRYYKFLSSLVFKLKFLFMLCEIFILPVLIETTLSREP